MPISPTQLSIRHFKQLNYHCAVVEHWNMFARVRQDLFGFGDVLAFHPDQQPVIIVQTTTANNVSARIKKIEANKIASQWLKSGNVIVVHGWQKVNNRWKLTKDIRL